MKLRWGWGERRRHNPYSSCSSEHNSGFISGNSFCLCSVPPQVPSISLYFLTVSLFDPFKIAFLLPFQLKVTSPVGKCSQALWSFFGGQGHSRMWGMYFASVITAPFYKLFALVQSFHHLPNPRSLFFYAH